MDESDSEGTSSDSEVSILSYLFILFMFVVKLICVMILL